MKHAVNVLYIDDENQNLTSFKALFRREFNVFTAENTKIAEEILKQETIHVIVSDQRMPNTTGTEFFEKIIDLYPEIIRILLTAYSDMDTIINAVNKGHIYYYLQKPWDEKELRLIIKNGYDSYNAKSQLNKRTHELEITNEHLSKMVYGFTHDLRAPITSIKQVMQTALKTDDYLNKNEYFKFVKESFENFDEFIKSMLDYYLTGKDKRIETVSFSQITDNVLSNFKFYNGVENIQIQKEIYSQKEDFYTDKLSVMVILNNLISNAIKYHDDSKKSSFIKINIEKNTAGVVLKIEDNGLGIADEHVNKIFEMFYTASRKDVQGSGIGLYIVAEAVKKIKGNIKVASRKGEGTLFTVTMPNLKV